MPVKKVKPGYKAAAKKDKKNTVKSEKRFYKAPPKKGAENGSKPSKGARNSLKNKTEATSGAGNAREVAKVIQWFPGHMTKALRQIEESLKMVDIVIELCDARIPFSSRNPEIVKVIGNKPSVLVCNKYDLADQLESFKKKTTNRSI